MFDLILKSGAVLHLHLGWFYFWHKKPLLLSSRMLGYEQGFPELGSPYGPAGADEVFQYTEISCKGDEENLLDCSLK